MQKLYLPVTIDYMLDYFSVWPKEFLGLMCYHIDREDCGVRGIAIIREGVKTSGNWLRIHGSNQLCVECNMAFKTSALTLHLFQYGISSLPFLASNLDSFQYHFCTYHTQPTRNIFLCQYSTDLLTLTQY